MENPRENKRLIVLGLWAQRQCLRPLQPGHHNQVIEDWSGTLNYKHNREKYMIACSHGKNQERVMFTMVRGSLNDAWFTTNSSLQVF